jgi:phospholipid transport system substrate-binding protein
MPERRYRGRGQDRESFSPAARPIQFDYCARKDSTKAGRCIDVVVAGVSLVTNYRDTFNQEVQGERR